MKVVPVCPAERPGLSSLTEVGPLVNLPILGKTLLIHWLEHLARSGATEVIVLASDRPDDIVATVGDGSRWGLRVDVRAEIRELSAAEALSKYGSEKRGESEANQVIVADYFPGDPQGRLFGSYGSLYQSFTTLLRNRAFAPLIGMHEIKPGIWVGRRARISPEARLNAPCWIGEHAVVGPKSVIGPNTVIEHRAFVAAGAEVLNSLIAPETYVGENTLVKDSLACGHILINHRTNSCLKVPDPYLLCGLREQHSLFKEVTWPSQVASLLVLALTLPFGVLALLKAKLQETPALRRLVIREEA